MKQQSASSMTEVSAASTKAAKAGKSRAATLHSPAQLDGPDRERMIREAAYRHYEERGCTDGYEVDDWLQAEADVERMLGAASGEAATD